MGTLAALLQSRRMTEGSINQNSAIIVVQGYLEQIKNMEFSDLPYLKADGTIQAGVLPADTTTTPTRYGINTRSSGDELTPDILYVSSGTPPNPSTVVGGAAAPTGIYDNTRSLEINTAVDTASTDNLQLRIWVWVRDITDNSIDATNVRSITMIYQYRVADGKRARWFVGSVRNIRSDVPTF